MRILFSGGGTGGHINPALAIAEVVKANVPNAEIAFVGTPSGMESRTVPKAGYKLYYVNIKGIKRSFSLSNVKSLYLAATSPSRAKKIVKEFAPDIVIGTGGYVCWPALKAAAELGIPTVLHESNALPGLAVRKLQNDVDIVLTNFESTAALLSPKANAVNVGNPLRSACMSITKEQARAKLGIPPHIKFVTLSFGGSLGSEQINCAAAEMMGNFASRYNDVMCYHVGGTKNFESAQKYFSAYGLERNPRFILMQYTEELPVYMAAADAVICRAGAVTLTEIAMMGKAAIIIPSPNVADDHQYKNAKELADADAAIVIRENEMKIEGRCRVCDAVEELYLHPEKRRELSDNIKTFAKEGVEKRIFEIIQKLIESHTKIIK